MKEINYQEYLDIKDNATCVIAFGAPWCRDCKIAEPFLVELSQKYTNINFYHVNVDKDENIRADLGIRHIPTILFLKNGEEVHTRVVEPHSIFLIEEGVLKL